MSIEEITRLEKQADEKDSILQNVNRELEQELKHIRLQYEKKVQLARKDRDDILYAIHTEIANVIENDTRWFDNKDMIELVSSAFVRERKSTAFADDRGEPVHQALEHFFNHKFLENFSYLVRTYGNAKYSDYEDFKEPVLVMPNIVISKSANDDELISLAELLEPYVDAIHEYSLNMKHKYVLISVFEHTYAQHGVICITSSSPGTYRIVDNKYEEKLPLSEDKPLIDILKDVREEYWSEDDKEN